MLRDSHDGAASASSHSPSLAPAESGATQSSPFVAPSVTQPRGGGAIRGIGEKFSSNAATGTGTLSVPIALPAGRSGFSPQLSLSYDSGAGNGPFGLGWHLSLPSITRKTDKGLPRYDDAAESDVFLLSGSEDLVPVLDNLHQRSTTSDPAAQYTIHRYRPRIEGLFARIERWTHNLTGEVHWRSITGDNVTTWYGHTDNSRISDPDDRTRVFSWLICASYDDRGNAIAYEYVPEDPGNVDLTSAHEANRSDAARRTNRYVRRIKYGNCTPNRDASDWTPTDPALLNDWVFEVLFDYDDLQYAELPLDATLPEAQQHSYVRAAAADRPAWSVRPDPWSDFRATFEIRTYRRCRRILSFHRFTELPVNPYLVRSTEIEYDDFDYTQPYSAADEAAHPGSTRTRSVVRSITQCGYVHDPTAAEPLRYLKRSFPPLEFDYTNATIDETVIDVEGVENLPAGVDGRTQQWVDLDGEGLSGAIVEQAGTWYYKRNVSALPVRQTDGTLDVRGRFEPLEAVGPLPSSAASNSSREQFLDLAGDGQVDLVDFHPSMPGYYERTDDGSWQMFVPFESMPNVPWDDPNLRFVDLTGDGHADVLIDEDDVFAWHPSLAEDGFAAAERLAKAASEDEGPRLVSADGSQSIYLSDMSGDGLPDLVRIRNGEVCYWPNLGYCRWGRKIAMDNAPWFDSPGQFDQARIRLTDLDGTGTTDIIYLGSEVAIFRNQCGNRWTDAQTLTACPATDSVADVTAMDLLGQGTACLVWSSPLAGNASRPMRYIDLMGGTKPHLLIGSRNNLGAETVVHYAPSTRFYLQDRRDGRPWITRLPFPVHVVERVETIDHVSRNRFVSRYAYHHGFFDGEEREFRGFSMVEQFDTLELSALAGDAAPPPASNVDPASHVPPVLTRTWFHTGVYLGRDDVASFFAGLLGSRGEYYREPGSTPAEVQGLLLDDTVIPGDVPIEEEGEACRALKGSMLRREVYALDGSGTSDYPYGHPYVVTEQNFGLIRIQGRFENRHAVFFAHPREAITYHYERNPADPRVSHTMTLAIDTQYGLMRKSASIGYGRRPGMSRLTGDDLDTQRRILISYTESDFTTAIDTAFDYRAPITSDTRTYQITGFALAGGQTRFDFDTWAANDSQLLRSLAPVPYHQPAPDTLPRKRLIEQVRTLYRPDDLGESVNDALALLPLHSMGALALPGESYRLAFSPALIDAAYARSTQPLMASPALVLAGGGRDGGGYVQIDGQWWIPSGRVFYSPIANASAAVERTRARQHFFVPRRYRDPFHVADPAAPWDTETNVDYDDYDLLLRETRDALGNRVTAGRRRLADDTLERDGNDYRVLQPFLVMDPNRNCAEAAFDAFGLLVGTAVMGKPEDTPAKGDRFDASFTPDLTRFQIDAFYGAADPHGPATALLADATTRIVYDLERFRRSRLAAPADPLRWEPVFAASLARETHVSDASSSQIRLTFSYSDGFAREIQKKVQAEPGRAPRRDSLGRIVIGADGQPELTPGIVSPRWGGNGWTIFNNKGNPVRQFEPFFSDTHRPDLDVRAGVSPVLFYDPIERVVATLHPNHTYEKVVFDAWQQIAYDANDTVDLIPRTDPDIAAYVEAYFNGLPPGWETWLRQRINPSSPPADSGGAFPDRDAAVRALAHAGTPSTVHLDSLGRTFLTVAANGFDSLGNPRRYRTRVSLDVEGNEREVTDAKGRVVMRYDYDMLGTRIHQASMEAGERWTLNDAAGKLLRRWDSRGHDFSTLYDTLRRSVAEIVRGTDAARSDPWTVPGPVLFLKTEYGEGQPGAATLNLRTRAYRLYDGAGIVTNAALNPVTNQLEAYDFKGNLLRSSRQVIPTYDRIIDWAITLGGGSSFVSSTRYDALNRRTEVTAPDGSVIRPSYNEANLLNATQVNLRGAASATPFITNIDYNARGQRTQVDYATADGAGVTTMYEYDPDTFLLTLLKTTRRANRFDLSDRPGEIQNLAYTYDSLGNLTHIADAAQDSIYFLNRRVDADNDYAYDPIYRLTSATGREHLGLNAGVRLPPTASSYNDWTRARRSHPGDGNALGTYTETYAYDEVGNFDSVTHVGTDPSDPGWTRTYTYSERSLLQSGEMSNRLTSTTIDSNDEIYSVLFDGYDAHGNMLRLPHLQAIAWDFLDRLQMTRRQKIDNADQDGAEHDGERTYYVYDASGKRVRKVTVLNGAIKNERVYLGGFEVYHEYGATPLDRETLHVMDDQQRIALVETKTSDAAPIPLIRYQFSNHLGTASLELDAADAEPISYEEYTPYGSTSYRAARAGIDPWSKRYRYTGKERDDETGFYYHGSRYYAPWLGRWTRCDPGGLVDGPNLYAYSRGRPTMLIDSTGRASSVKINDVVPYNQTLENRADIGVNAQKDHVISQGKQKLLNPDINTSKQLTVVQETGAAKGGAPAKPHTEVTFHDPQSDVAEIKRIRAMAPEQWTSFEAEVVSPSIESRYRAGYSQSSTNIAAVDEIGSMFEVNQPNRAPNSSSPKLDWTVKTEPVGPAVDPQTGRVIPETTAAPESSVAAESAVTAEPAASTATSVEAPPTVTTATPVVEPTAAPKSSVGAGVRGAAGTGLKVLGAVGLALAAKDVIKNVRHGNYGRAAVTTGLTALSFTAAMPVVMAAGVAMKYRSDPTIDQRSFAAGDWVQEKTGSVIVGGIASAGAAVGLSIYESGADMVHGVRNFFSDW